MMFVQKNSNTSNLSLESLKAYAQTGGENGEGGEGGGENSTCEGSDSGYQELVSTENTYSWWNDTEGKMYKCTIFDVVFICDDTGPLCGTCGERLGRQDNCIPS